MNPITHLLVSWELASLGTQDKRERQLITLAGVLPDVDGLSIGVDLAYRLAGTPDTAYFGRYHHQLSHGLPAALVMAGVCGILSTRRWRTGLLGLGAFHLHLLCDFVGSRGPDEIWPVPYLAPLSDALSFSWSGQWAVNGWPNILLTVFLLGLLFYRVLKGQGSPLSLVSARAEAEFVAAVRGWGKR